jgi:hypothetical protein
MRLGCSLRSSWRVVAWILAIKCPENRRESDYDVCRMACRNRLYLLSSVASDGVHVMPDQKEIDCPRCHGKRKVEKLMKEISPGAHPPADIWETCPNCGGTGRVKTKPD